MHAEDDLILPGDDPLFAALLPACRVEDDAAQHAAGGVCRHCRLDTTADDSWLQLRNGWCICLRCALTTVGGHQEMPAALRRSVSQTVNEVANG